MKRIVVEGKSRSKVLIGESFTNVGKYLPEGNVVIITDDNLHKYYADEFPNFPIIKISTGEKIKTITTVEDIISQLIELGVDRHSFLLGIGGGIVCDITGFVASIYMRGIDFGFISTSLLSQVDASVGGKNGVNFNSYKNVIGNFNQPKFVICDTNMLKTLPRNELSSGMGEVLKYAILADQKLFKFIKNNIPQIQKLDNETIMHIVYQCIFIKADIVSKDEKEFGERKKLNLGHTLGHAIEKHSSILHGEAISIGMVFSAFLSAQKGLVTIEELEEIKSVILALGLPVSTNVEKSKMAEAIAKDKKKNKSNIDFVFIKGIGEAIVESMTITELKERILDYEYK